MRNCSIWSRTRSSGFGIPGQHSVRYGRIRVWLPFSGPCLYQQRRFFTKQKVTVKLGRLGRRCFLRSLRGCFQCTASPCRNDGSLLRNCCDLVGEPVFRGCWPERRRIPTTSRSRYPCFDKVVLIARSAASLPIESPTVVSSKLSFRDIIKRRLRFVDRRHYRECWCLVCDWRCVDGTFLDFTYH